MDCPLSAKEVLGLTVVVGFLFLLVLGMSCVISLLHFVCLPYYYLTVVNK